jgi:hypothetical protein
VKDLWEDQKVSISGKQLNEEDPAIPCGLVAKSFFNDTYQLFREHGNGTREEIIISQKNIAWNSDVETRFNNVVPRDGIGSWQDIQWHDMTDEHFIVWMRSAALPTFQKLWGRVDKGLQIADYYLVVHNNYRYEGEKSFVISTISSLGGKDTFLSTCYIVMAVFCSMVSLSFCSLEMQQKKQHHEKASILHEDMRKLSKAKEFLSSKLTGKK